MEYIPLLGDQLKIHNHLLLYIYLQLGLDACDVQVTDSFTEEKGMNERKLDFLHRHDIAEVKAKVGS